MTSETYHSQYKLMKHLDRVLTWSEQGTCYPINLSIDLTDNCNNRCPRCAGIGENKGYGASIPIDKFKSLISEFRGVGVKAIDLGGGGDPSCHPHLSEAIRDIKSKGLDVGISTNGYELSDGVVKSIIDCCTWARVSLDADSPEIYKKTHGMEGDAFNQVLENMGGLVSSKNQSKSNIVLGCCYLVGPHTISGVKNAARLVKEIGFDYIRFRPFFNYGEQKRDFSSDLEKCLELADDTFTVSFDGKRAKGGDVRPYTNCEAQHFVTSISADLNVYPCCLLNREEYSFGNLSENTFKEVWNSERRRKIYKSMGLKDCPNPCMLDKHNRLLDVIAKGKPTSEITLKEVLKSIAADVPHQNFL